MTADDIALLYSQLTQQGSTENNAGQGLSTAANVVNGISKAASFVPVVGSAVAGIGGIISGALEAGAASKQKSQGAADIQKALNMSPKPLPNEFNQKLTADEMAANSPAPGLQQYHDALSNSFAMHLRSIYNNSRNGAQAVSAAATALGFDNESLSKLYADSLQYQAKQSEAARKDLWDIGQYKYQAQKDLFNDWQKPLLEQGTALQNAATANNMKGLTDIVGSASKGIASGINYGFHDMLNKYTNTGTTTKATTTNPVAANGLDNVAYSPSNVPDQNSQINLPNQYNPIWDTTLGNGQYN